jgi:hypothetical protein
MLEATGGAGMVADAETVDAATLEVGREAAGALSQPASNNNAITASTGLRTALTLPHLTDGYAGGNRREEP